MFVNIREYLKILIFIICAYSIYAVGPTTEMTGGISSCSSLINNNENRSSCTADNVNNGVNVIYPRAAGTRAV